MASSNETFFSASFTDHLYHALSDGGIQTFRDNDGIDRGENINLELEKAIKTSRISIIVFSKNYVSSKACRYEVETILENSKKSKHVILPVFYDVDPSEVKEQAEGLVIDKGQDEQMNNVKRSSATLKEVANIAGRELKNQADGHKAKFIKDIVQWVKDKKTWQAVSVPTHLVGMESRVNKIDWWLTNCSDPAGKLVISGMGGIGKTALAKVLYNRHYDTFNGSSFHENIRQVSKNSNSVVHLQRQLLSNLQNKREHKVLDVDDGHRRLKFVLSRKRVLLVLDDVENENQIKAILGQERDLFFQGSKIIITTRKEGLLERSEIDITHDIGTPSDIESLELFSWHAFGQKHPVDDYTEHAKRFLHHCNGLPLALEVFGSSVREQRLAIWESKLKKLEVIPNSEIVEKLRISYDDLDLCDRKLFLDIAFFFLGKKETDMLITLDNAFLDDGIQNLIRRNLLKIENGKLSMHPLLQSMGKAIVEEESTHPQERCRLWRHEESFKILRDQTGTEKIEGLIIDRFERLKEDNEEQEKEEATEAEVKGEEATTDVEEQEEKKKELVLNADWKEEEEVEKKKNIKKKRKRMKNNKKKKLQK